MEKTSNARIRERLMLEDTLTLDKALKISAQIENAAAEAKMIASSGGGTESVVGVVRGTTFRGGRQKQQRYSSYHCKPPQAAAAALSVGQKVAGKTCYRCGSSSHVANHPKCPAKSATCRLCTKHGHFARVCKSRDASCSVGEVSGENVTVLLVDENDTNTRSSKVSCTVSLVAASGSPVTVDLIVDTGSGVSILPEHLYKTHFSHTPPESQKKSGYLHKGTDFCSWLFGTFGKVHDKKHI